VQQQINAIRSGRSLKENARPRCEEEPKGYIFMTIKRIMRHASLNAFSHAGKECEQAHSNGRIKTGEYILQSDVNQIFPRVHADFATLCALFTSEFLS
jgi:hypothetical protein